MHGQQNIKIGKVFSPRREYFYIYQHLIADGQVTSPLLSEHALKNIVLTKMDLQV